MQNTFSLLQEQNGFFWGWGLSIFKDCFWKSKNVFVFEKIKINSLQTLLRIAKKEEKVKCSSQQSPSLPFPFLLSDFWLFGITPSFYFCLKMHLDTKCDNMQPGNSITREIWGPYKRTKSVSLRQAKFYLLQQALAAALQ